MVYTDPFSFSFLRLFPTAAIVVIDASEKHNHLLRFELQRSGVINAAKDFLHSRVAQRPFEFTMCKKMPRYSGELARQLAEHFIALNYFHGVFVHGAVKLSFSNDFFFPIYGFYTS